MKQLKRFLKDIFAPGDFNNLDTQAIRDAFNDSSVRAVWLSKCLEEIKRLNIEVEKRLLSDSGRSDLTDICSRRKAIQDMLEDVLSAKRQVVSGTQDLRQNPFSKNDVNLDRVTA